MNQKYKKQVFVLRICNCLKVRTSRLHKLLFCYKEAKLILNYFSLLLITSILPLLKKRNFMVQWLHRWHCCNKGKLRQALTRQLNRGRRTKQAYFSFPIRLNFQQIAFHGQLGWYVSLQITIVSMWCQLQMADKSWQHWLQGL